jgi:hypothetical protein
MNGQMPFKVEYDAATAAMARGDMQAAVGHYLAAVIIFHEKDHSIRFGLFSVLQIVIYQEQFKLTEQNISVIKRRFLNNKKEPVHYRADAAYILAKNASAWTSSMSPCPCPDASKAAATVYYQRVLDFCDGASSRERRKAASKLFLPGDGGECSVGELLDGLKREADYAIKLAADPVDDFSRPLLGITGINSEVASELFQSTFLSSQGRNPSAITSTVIEQVKALPEEDVILLIQPDEDFLWPDADLLSPLPSGASKRVYRALTVDLENFHSGRKTVFDQLQVLPCDSLQSRQRNILSTFVLACLEPYVFLPNTPQACPSARPRKVLLEYPEDPQVLMFLSMMGCTVVEAASPALLALLDETKVVVTAKSSRQAFAFAPHLGDYVQGIQCGNCATVGPKLKKCPCGKAYYCSTECQKDQWKMHMSEHKSALARKNAKANS